MPFISLSVLPR